VVITGCRGGIGRACATLLIGSGYDVVATAREPDGLAAIGPVLAARPDVTDQASIETAIDAVLERFGRIDAVVNCAGYAIRGAVEELEPEAVARMFDVNVNGMIRLVAGVPVMRRQRAGRIITIGSIGGSLTAPGNGAYAASKHALEALTDSAARRAVAV
jgi:NAD(P)-dependent dehydrogenase (short-subunit alcohol dehydrogenase family)